MNSMATVNVATPKNECQHTVNRFPTECQQSVNDFGSCILYITRAVVWHLPIMKILATIMDNMVSVNIARPKNEPQQSINRASTIVDAACWIIEWQFYGIYL